MTSWCSLGQSLFVTYSLLIVRFRLTFLPYSCGFDASEHEYPSMSRHQRKVPTAFYHRFAKDARVFAEKYAKGKLISVLEGGYSDRALTSGALAHLAGLVDDEGEFRADETWWHIDNLKAVSLPFQ